MSIDPEAFKDGVTIESILDRHGIKHKHGRAKCPLHDGLNPTAFSFTDTVFKCHSCGAGGDVIKLLELLLKTDFLGVMEYLAQIKGIEFKRNGAAPVIPRRNKSMAEVTKELQIDNLLYDLEWDTTLRKGNLHLLQLMRKDLKENRIPAATFYSREASIDHEIETLTDNLIATNDKIKECQGELREIRRANANS